MTAPQTTRLGHYRDYLTDLAQNPPTTPDAHRDAACTLLRHAAEQARDLTDNGRDVEARVSTLTRLATVYTRLAAL